MVLEALVNPFVVKKKPWEMFVAGIAYAVAAMVLAYVVFRQESGLLTVFLMVLAALPTVYVTIKEEEKLDEKYDKEWFLLKEHTKVIIFLMFLFMGMVVGLLGAYIFMPETVVNTLFSTQQEAINHANSIQGSAIKSDLLVKILLNNFTVLFFCVVFSFAYGTGAIFILSWNASVIATAMGGLVKGQLAQAASAVGYHQVAAYFGAVGTSFLRYMTHGALEMAAYFIAGLAGGIISIALIRHKLQDSSVLLDALFLVIISIGVTIIAGIIEVYVTPMVVPWL